MPEADADRVVRSLRENGGRVTNLLRRDYPAIFDNVELATEVTEAVNTALELPTSQSREVPEPDTPEPP